MTIIADALRLPGQSRVQSRATVLFVCGFLPLHLFVWTVLPLAFTHALPVDTIEGVIWGQGWQLSYVHPPLQAWLIGATDWLVGYQRWAIYLVSQLLIAAGFLAVWLLARLIVTPTGALVSVLSLEGVVFFNFMTPNLFPDLIVVPFWALATWSLYRALRDDRRLDWLLLGLWLAGAAYAKYVGAILALVMIGFMLIEPRARRCWQTPGPYLAAAVCLVLLAPHLWWVSTHGFPTVERFAQSARETDGIVERVSALGGFTISQVGVVALAVLLIVALRDARHATKPIALAGSPSRFERRFVAVFALAPIVVTWTAAALTGTWFRAHWSYAMWSFLGLFAVVFVVPSTSERGLKRFLAAWSITFGLIATAYAAANTLAPAVDSSPGRHLLSRYAKESAFPAEDLAEAITRSWHAMVGTPFAYVIGSKWIAGHVSFFSADHPLVVRNGTAAVSPWIDMQDVRQHGAVVVWNPATDFTPHGSYPGWLAGRDPQQLFPTMVVQPNIVLPWRARADLPPLTLSWGIIYPDDGSAGRRESQVSADPRDSQETVRTGNTAIR